MFYSGYSDGRGETLCPCAWTNRTITNEIIKAGGSLMFVLLSNDDGIQAPGLKTLAKEFADEHEVAIVALIGSVVHLVTP